MLSVYVVVAHPEGTTSYVVGVFASWSAAEDEKYAHEEETGNQCAVMGPYEVSTEVEA